MGIIFIPAQSADAWQALLAQPDRQWKKGFSARTLAHCWQQANGFPPEVAAVLGSPPAFPGIEPLLAIPELKVQLPGGRRASQTDLWVLARWSQGLVSIAVEGKVAEPLGPTVGAWLAGASEGKGDRLRSLLILLEIDAAAVGPIRYQLLHRAASAIIQAQRFAAGDAVLLVHSFSGENAWFDDFARFEVLLGQNAHINEIAPLGTKGGVRFHAAWVRGDPRFLDA
jgi:hypothetical protein